MRVLLGNSEENEETIKEWTENQKNNSRLNARADLIQNWKK